MSVDVVALLARVPGCARLGLEAQESLERQARREDLAPGAVLVTEGTPAPDLYWIVESGAVHVSRLDVEADEVLDFLTAGDVLDPGPPGHAVPFSARAVGPTRCLAVPQSAVARCREAAPGQLPTAFRAELSLFVRRVGDIIKGPPLTSGPETPVNEAARAMAQRGVGSIVVLDRDGRPRGIVTDRDLRTKVLAAGLPPTTPVAAVMSAPLISVGPGALAFETLLEMTRRNIHHLGVVEAHRLVGVVSSHDLLFLQGAHPVALVREIESQDSVDALAAVAPRVAAVVRWLAGEGAGVFDIGRFVAELSDRLVRRAVSLTEAALAAEGTGPPPVPYSWLAAGSEGRREQTLRTDQDNALVYADPPSHAAPAVAAHFEHLASRVGEALARLGFPRCEGGYMASNPQWCRALSVWRELFHSWMTTPKPEPVLRASIFFDIRPVAGDEGPGRALWEWVCAEAPSRILFLRHMAKAAVEHTPPLGLFGRLVVERTGAHKDRLDLKARGVLPMTQAMRVHALALGVRETNTVDRLAAVGARGIFGETRVAELRDAYEVISRLRLRHQLACLDAGRPPDNFVDPQALGKADRLLLREAFRSLTWLQRDVEERFQTSAVT